MLNTWESLLLGAFAILLLFWMQPGLKAAIARSQQTPSDWQSLLLPLGLLILFVILLIATV